MNEVDLFVGATAALQIKKYFPQQSSYEKHIRCIFTRNLLGFAAVKIKKQKI